MLLVLILLLSLTNCKTTETIVYIPEIILPEPEEEPVHKKWNFIWDKEIGYHKITDQDLQILVNYIVDLKDYGADAWDWVQYVKDETERFELKYRKLDN